LEEYYLIELITKDYANNPISWIVSLLEEIISYSSNILLEKSIKKKSINLVLKTNYEKKNE